MAIPWDEERAAHLYRRAAFGGTGDDIRRAMSDGLEATVDRLLEYRNEPNDLLDARLSAQNFYLKSDGKLTDLARWWLIRLIFTARPLEERMTLFWHDHFATAYTKVLHIGWLKQENDTIRTRALGSFRDLMLAVAQDCAMMYWLDTWLNTKTNLNENFGRELLELFTLGVGHYTESDVFAAARAFTGWAIEGTKGVFLFKDQDHDYSTKTFLGSVGPWNGNDVIRIACSEFAHGRWIASKLFAYFAYDNAEQDVIDRLARVYLDSDTDLAALVRAILTSEEMYSEKSLWKKVKSPIEHAVIATRQLMLTDDVPNTFEYLNQGGQTPFDPPDVSGWNGGLEWINPSAMLSRMNFADAVSRRFDPIAFTRGETFRNAEELVNFYLRRLGPLELPPAAKSHLLSYVTRDGSLPAGERFVSRQRGLARMILSLPEWQMF